MDKLRELVQSLLHVEKQLGIMRKAQQPLVAESKLLRSQIQAAMDGKYDKIVVDEGHVTLKSTRVVPKVDYQTVRAKLAEYLTTHPTPESYDDLANAIFDEHAAKTTKTLRLWIRGEPPVPDASDEIN